MIPIMTKDSVVSKKIARALGSAMWMYDLTGGWRIGGSTSDLRPRQPPTTSRPTDVEQLSAGYLYFDAGADDARLTPDDRPHRGRRGAVLVNRCAVVDRHRRSDGRASASSSTRRDRFESGRASSSNAAGVWADEVRALDEGADPDSIRPAKGVHITVPWDEDPQRHRGDHPGPRRQAQPVPRAVGRLADGTFRHTYVGTTDTDYDGPLDDPQCDATISTTCSRRSTRR